MPETHELPLDVIRKAWDENVKPGAQHDEAGSPWASFTCYGNEERAVKFARAILTAAREADAPELPWVTVCQLAKSVIADEGAGVAHWQRVGFPDHVIRAAVEAGAKAQRALGVPRQSDEAARIALRRDALVHLMSEMRKGPLMRWAAEDVESFTDDEYPLPARGCVTDPADEFAAALSSFVANTAYRLAHDPHGEVGPVERQALKDIKDALKSFAAGVGR